VVLRVSYREDGRPPAYVVYRFGEDVRAVVSAFLDGEGVTDAGARADAVATIVPALVARASAALAAAEVALGGGGGGGGGGDDPVAPRDFVLPLMVGELGFDVTLRAGTSLRAAARLFCEQQWAALQPAMQRAVDAVHGAGEAAAAGGGPREVTLETCRGLVLDLMVEFAAAGAK
jgi:hypothetical protein